MWLYAFGVLTVNERGCATKFQIIGLKEVSEEDPTKAPGYDRLSSEAQEQVRLAFENEDVVDKDFKGVDTDLAKVPKKYGGEIQNATSYKVDLATRATASCRKSDCPKGALKIAKGELRLGIHVPFDDDHGSWMYKHWWAPESVHELATVLANAASGCASRSTTSKPCRRATVRTPAKSMVFHLYRLSIRQ
jgi:hypothetical protein